MKRILCIALLLLVSGSTMVFAEERESEPTIYVVKKGDTLWGLSARFLRDPFYWPNLWARNESITNPHLIVPGQKVKVYPDRIEPVPSEVQQQPGQPVPEAPAAAPVSPAPPEEVAEEKIFAAGAGAGFILEKGLKPAGYVIATQHNRDLIGGDDVVFTDIGLEHGGKVGDRFTIFQKGDAISHPVSNVILGYNVIPLGVLQLTEMTEKGSRAIVTRSYQEIGNGAYLMPYREKRREISLKAASREISGYIVESQAGNNAISAGDIVYLDLGKKQGIELGNILYIVRPVSVDQQYVSGPAVRLPNDLLGAVVVVDRGENTSAALVVKSIDTIYRGDIVELKKNR